MHISPSKSQFFKLPVKHEIAFLMFEMLSGP